MKLAERAVKAIIIKKGKILLLQRNPKVRQGEENWDLPGGLIEPGEDEKTTLQREVLEEVNLRIKITGPAGKWRFKRLVDKKIVSVKNYRCEIFGDESTIKISLEHINFRWILPSEIDNFPLKDVSLAKNIKENF